MDFFQGTFGFKESIQNVYKYISIEDSPDGVIMKDSANGCKWNSGTFKVWNCNEIPKHESRGNGHLHIICGNGMSSEKYWLVDVLPAQSHPENDGATFLAASNFNALEFVSPNQTANEGISSYPYDRTQGPYCAIACGPSILYRNYFVKVPGSKKVGQLNKEIELLGDTPIPVHHGYAQISKSDEKKLEKSKFNFSDISKYKVASHSNCEVTMTRKDNKFEHVETKQFVHHVYAAALNFAYSVNFNSFTQNIAEHLLEAEYRATILTAWDNSVNYPNRAGSKKLYLALLGGGVFANPMDLICEQIAKCKDLIVESGLDVYIVCFNKYVFDNCYPYLKSTMKETGGKVIEA